MTRFFILISSTCTLFRFIHFGTYFSLSFWVVPKFPSSQCINFSGLDVTSWEHHGMLGNNGFLFFCFFFGGTKWCKISTLAWNLQFLQQDFEQPFCHCLCSMNMLDAMTHLLHPSLTSRCSMFL